MTREISTVPKSCPKCGSTQLLFVSVGDGSVAVCADCEWHEDGVSDKAAANLRDVYKRIGAEAAR